MTRSISLFDSLERLRETIEDLSCEHEEILPTEKTNALLKSIDEKLDKLIELMEGLKVVLK